MTTGYILIAAILILGGVIATVGDRIGTRVGKARLSLFNLRPRKTAVVVTILTGGMISATTLAILFAADEGLRTGVFELEEIQDDLRAKRQDLETQRQQLDTAKQQKDQVERELARARAQQIEAQNRQAVAQQRLKDINQSLQAAIARQAQTEAQLKRTRTQQAQTQSKLELTQGELEQISQQFEQARAVLQSVSQQAKALREEVKQRQAERQRLIEQVKAAIAKRDAVIANLDEAIENRDQRIAQLDRAIQERDRELAARNEVIAQREAGLKELEAQQQTLEQEVARLEQYYQSYRDLRLGKLAVVRGQVLAAGVVQIEQPTTARDAVIELLRQANRSATVELTEPGVNPANEQVVQMTEAQVEQLIKQIDDGRPYVVRILSAGNYVKGEKQIQIFADAARNQVVFSAGDVVAATTADPKTMTSIQLRQRLDLLLFASQFRARRAGILEDTIQIGDGRIETFIRFIEQLKQYDQPLDLKAVAAQDTYTAGPLKVELVAMQNGQVVFRT